MDERFDEWTTWEGNDARIERIAGWRRERERKSAD